MGNAVKCHSVTTTTNMGVGTAGLGQGLATGCQDASPTLATQRVNIVRDVTGNNSIVDNGLDTALLTHTVTGELSDNDLKNGLSTSPLAQTVTGEWQIMN